ncbi:MAG: peptidoglycan-binding domain-containing protein [Candidatus Limiplasma sp.]|nr:peptidoglycan-binding domain-containing protein [Candidatus Limiplasma sp.]
MSRPSGDAVAAKAIAAVAEGHTYAEMDCQAFVEYCVNQCGGRMAYAGSNDMYRNAAAYLATIENARAEGKLVPGAGLLIVEEVSGGTPAKYRGDGLGDATHVGLYVGEKALTDTDKNGKSRVCNVVHSGSTMGRVAGSTLNNGWTHVILFREIDYAGVSIPSGVVVGGALSAADIVKDNPEGLSAADAADVRKFYTVKRGCKGGAVRRLQTWLNDVQGGDLLAEDGDFGPATDAAVRVFQRAQGLTADGIVGPKTWAALAAARQAAASANVGE